jgi:hypothetical protein
LTPSGYRTCPAGTGAERRTASQLRRNDRADTDWSKRYHRRCSNSQRCKADQLQPSRYLRKCGRLNKICTLIKTKYRAKQIDTNYILTVTGEARVTTISPSRRIIRARGTPFRRRAPLDAEVPCRTNITGVLFIFRIHQIWIDTDANVIPDSGDRAWIPRRSPSGTKKTSRAQPRWS